MKELELGKMLERKYDQKLNIRTSGIKELKEKNHNRVEPTPYEALEVLVRNYRLEEGDRLVDFGCGRGRVMFYLHDYFNVAITGVEADDQTIDEALLNRRSYLYHKENPAPLKIEYGLAEMYEISPEDNRFYFFNPFELPIYKKVIYNILQSVNKHPRRVELIMYYPLPEFKHFLHSRTPFELIQEFPVPKIHGKYGRFAIYRYEAEEEGRGGQGEKD